MGASARPLRDPRRWPRCRPCSPLDVATASTRRGPAPAAAPATRQATTRTSRTATVWVTAKWRRHPAVSSVAAAAQAVLPFAGTAPDPRHSAVAVIQRPPAVTRARCRLTTTTRWTGRSCCWGWSVMSGGQVARRACCRALTLTTSRSSTGPVLASTATRTSAPTAAAAVAVRWRSAVSEAASRQGLARAPRRRLARADPVELQPPRARQRQPAVELLGVRRGRRHHRLVPCLVPLLAPLRVSLGGGGPRARVQPTRVGGGVCLSSPRSLLQHEGSLLPVSGSESCRP